MTRTNAAYDETPDADDDRGFWAGREHWEMDCLAPKGEQGVIE